MKLFVQVHRTVIQTKDIPIEVPDEELIGLNPAEAETKFVEKAEAQAGDEDFSGLEKGADYHVEDPCLPFHINWVNGEDGHTMVIGSMAPKGTVGTVQGMNT
jgi:hypothetical protein